jgi:DNA invertase Pin-like site-specific DNA recombinase
MKDTNEYAGRRYLCQIRCSTNQQVETSIPDQVKLLRAFGDQHDMTYVDSVILEGVTGSVPGARNDIEQIIRRKKTADDFDVLLVQDVSRLTLQR